MPAYDTILFDSDGVLVTPPAYETQAGATVASFRAVGVENVDRQYVDEFVTGVSVDRLHEICTACDLDAEELWQEWERQDERSQVEMFREGSRGCYEDVASIVDLPQNCGIVSNNHHSTIEFVLDFFELDEAFDAYYGREKTIESLELQKPNTHYIDRALSDLETESALYVGDSENDVVAADRRGMDSAFVRRAYCHDVDLTTTPTFEMESLRDLSEIVNGTPDE